MEIFSDPRALPCLHTFCLKCLQSYISSLKLELDDTSFECPVCRKRTYPTSSDLSKNIWAENFPSNYTIKALIEDTTINGTDDKTCKVSEQQKHGNCRRHVEKLADFFCADHTLTVCSICVALHHRKCAHVVYLGTDNELRCDTDSSFEEEVPHLLEDIKLHPSEYIQISSKPNTSKEVLQNKDKQNQVLTQITTATNAGDRPATRDVMSKSALRHESILRRTTVQHKVSNIQVKEQLMDTTAGQGVASYSSNNAFEADLVAYESNTFTNSRQQQRADKNEHLQMYRFRRSSDSLEDERKLLNADVSAVPSQLKPQNEFTVRIHGDQNYCSITGIASFPNGNLLLADESNKKLKLFTNTGEHVCHLSLTSAPWDVASIEEFEAAVTLPVQQRVQLVYVDNHISKTREIQLERPCYGISYSDQQFFIAMEGSIYVLAYCGEILKKLSLSGGRKKRFSFSNSRTSFDGVRYLSVDPNSKPIVMYVSSAGNPGLFAVESGSGDIQLVTQGNAGRMLGVSVCTNGRVLVCQSPGSLMIVSKHKLGSRSKELLQAEKVQTVHFDNLDGHVYLSQRLDDYLRIYKLQS